MEYSYSLTVPSTRSEPCFTPTRISTTNCHITKSTGDIKQRRGEVRNMWGSSQTRMTWNVSQCSHDPCACRGRVSPPDTMSRSQCCQGLELQQVDQNNVQEIQKPLRNPKRHEVPRSTTKNSEVPRSTTKHHVLATWRERLPKANPATTSRSRSPWSVTSQEVEQLEGRRIREATFVAATRQRPETPVHLQSDRTSHVWERFALGHVESEPAGSWNMGQHVLPVSWPSPRVPVFVFFDRFWTTQSCAHAIRNIHESRPPHWPRSGVD